MKWVKPSYEVDDGCRTGVLDWLAAGVLVHAARAGGAAAPHAAVLWVGGTTAAAVLTADRTVEQSHCREAERRIGRK